jgi:hypothetical protein
MNEIRPTVQALTGRAHIHTYIHAHTHAVYLSHSGGGLERVNAAKSQDRHFQHHNT